MPISNRLDRGARLPLQVSAAARRLVIGGVAAALLIAPGAMGPALAASKGTAATVETIMGSDGAVVSQQTVTSSADGATSTAYSGAAPIKTAIRYTLNGQPANRDQIKGAHGPMTAAFEVRNDTGKAQDVAYVGADGQTHTASTVIQVPFVATVEATVPKAYSNVQADGATISTAGDGTLHLLWSMVLFSPIGSPTQEVSFSAQADGPAGLPGVLVRARPVDPGADALLSANARAANATQTQDELLHAINGGADDGLTKLRAGVTSLVDGLKQLHDGSQQLSDGLGAASAGSKKLADGLHSADAGGHQLADGFRSPTGASDLTSGSTSLAAGLAQIDAGLAQLADPSVGLARAQAGSLALTDGVNRLLAGLGTYSTASVPNPPTILYGLKASRDGLAQLEAGITTQVIPGVGSEISGLATVRSKLLAIKPFVSAAPGTCGPASCQAALQGLANAIGTSSPGPVFPPTLIGGLNKLSFGLSRPPGTLGLTDPGGAVQVFDLINTGDTSGLGKVTGGLGQVKGGLSNPLCVITNPTNPLNPCGLLQGLTSLNGGLGSAVAGVTALHTGSTAASAGANKLRDGIATAGAGAAKLSGGLDQLAAGADQLSAGVPAAVAGSGKITSGLASAQDGAGQVNGGLADLQTKAVGPLGSQLGEGSSNARLELATLEATGARAATAPQGADTTWVYRLDAATPVADTQTGRNVAFGGGAVIVLLLGAVGGFLLGRRGRVGA